MIIFFFNNHEERDLFESRSCFARNCVDLGYFSRVSQEALHSCLVKLNVFKGSLPQEPLEGRWRCWTYPWVMRRVLYNYCSSLIHILDHQLVCHAIRGAISWLYLPLTSALTASSKAHNSTACFAQNFTRSRTIKLATTWWTSQHERNAHQIEVKCKHFWVVSAIFSMVANLNQAPAMHKKTAHSQREWLHCCYEEPPPSTEILF